MKTRSLFIISLAVLFFVSSLVAQDSSDVRMVGRYNHFDWSYLRDIDLQGNYAYLISRNYDLIIVDISDPEYPREISRVPRNNADLSYNVDVSGDLAYSTRGTFINIFDISDIAHPRDAGHIDVQGYVWSFALYNNYILVSTHEGLLRIFDISDMENPVESGSIEIDAYIHRIVVQDHFAYMALARRRDRAVRGVWIVDLSDPENLRTASILSYEEDQRDIAINGDFCYAISEESLFILNISDPENPFRAGFFPAENGDEYCSITVSDNLAYIIPLNGDLRIIDIADPRHPLHIGSFPDAGLSPYSQYVIQDNILYGVGEGGMSILDVADPENPSRISFYNKSSWINSVSGREEFVYVTYRDCGLGIIDFSDPEFPVEIGFWWSEYAYNIAINEQDLLYVITRRSNREGMYLGIIDISDPTAPREIGAWNPPEYTYWTDFTISEDYIYAVAGNGRETLGLRIFDLSDPENPEEIGFCYVPLTIKGIVIQGDYAYIANDRHGVRILNVADPENPFEVGLYDSLTSVADVAAAGNYVYTINRNRWLHVINVSDPENPFRCAAYRTRGEMLDVTVDANECFLYLADGTAGMRVFEITNPGLPHEVGFYDTPGNAVQIFPFGEFAYVADGNNVGLYDCTQALNTRMNKYDIPTLFNLSNPYPNPFNSTTRLTYDLPISGRVKLHVYNPSGRLVTTLLDGYFQAGRNMVVWDGSSAVSGVYLMKMETAGFNMIRTITLVK